MTMLEATARLEAAIKREGRLQRLTALIADNLYDGDRLAPITFRGARDLAYTVMEIHDIEAERLELERDA